MRTFFIDLGISLLKNSEVTTNPVPQLEPALITRPNRTRVSLKLMEDIDPLASINKHLNTLNEIVRDIEIDLSRPNEIALVLLLNGEDSPINFRISVSKSIDKKDNRLRIEDIGVTKPWIEILINEIILDLLFDDPKNKEFSVPPFIHSLIVWKYENEI